MNERIKQLLLEAGFKIFGDKIVAGDFGSSGNATLCSQKFAELLVKQCMDIAKNRTTAPYEMGMSEKTRTAWNIYMDIADRFGAYNEQQI